MSKIRSNTFAVIDIGTSKVTTLIAELKGDGVFDIIGIGIEPAEGVKKGVVLNLNDAAQAVHRSVDAAEKMAGIIINSAVVGVFGDSITANEQHGMVNIDDPARGITRCDMRRAAEAAHCLLLPPDKQIINTIEMDYYVDGHAGVRDPRGMSGSRLGVDVQIITGSSSLVQNLTRCVMKLDIEIEALVPTPLASGEAVLNDDEKEIGSVVIDIGAGTTDVSVFKNHVVRKIRIFPMGSWNIDNDIAIVLGASTREGERLKLQYGIAYVDDRVGSEPVKVEHVSQEKEQQVTRGMLCQIIHARVMDMLKMVRHDLETDMPISLVPAGVVLTGNGSLLEGLPKVVEQVLGMSARVGRPRYRGPNSDRVSEPAYATAVGLLQYVSRVRQFGDSGATDSSPLRNLFRNVSNIFRGLFR